VIQVLEIKSKLLWKGLYVMERHLTTSTVSIGKRHEGTATGIGVERLSTAFDRSSREQPGRSDQGSMPGCVSVWTHTLILTGELTHRSAHTLEIELERLCDEGVTAITLDLRQLAQIDPIGVVVIAFRCELLQRRGFRFTLIPGSRLIQSAFERAGVSELLPFQVDEVAARRLRAATPRAAFSRRR
jgi:anti-anti-sigma factor